jgi:hypothetical protein
VTADAHNGHFCLPNHIDFVSALVPGLLIYEDLEGNGKLVAVDEGDPGQGWPDVTGFDSKCGAGAVTWAHCTM